MIVFNPAIFNHFLFLTRWISETSYDINKSQLVFTYVFVSYEEFSDCSNDFSTVHLKQVIALLRVSFFFSRKIVYKLVDMALNIVFGRKRLEYATCGQVFVRKRRKESPFSKIKNTCGRYLCVVWKWSWWLCEIIEHCSLRKVQSVIKKNKRGRTKEISEAGLISRIAFILMYSKSV